MSTQTAPEVMWRGEAVTIGEVLASLSGIRRKFALADAGEDEHPRPRNCVMTLVAVATNDADEQRAQSAIIAIAAQHPSLAIIVCEEPKARMGRIDASISTHPLSPSSASTAQCEIVSLRVRGAAGEHLAALVDPLLLSGIPTYLWWLATPPFGTKELVDALRICDALVVDSSEFDRPHESFLGLAELAATTHSRIGVADLQWARLDPWRETLAQFFEPKDRRIFLDGIAEVGVDYVGEGRGNRIAAGLLIGWFASALGWKVQRAVGGPGGIVVAHFAAESGRQVEAAFRSVSKSHLAPGEISAVRVAGASGGTFKLTIQRDPERDHRVTSEVGPREFQYRHHPGGEDYAGLEVALRRAAQNRDILSRNREALHHIATGDLPGEAPQTPTVRDRDRRHGDNPLVLLTMIDIGEGETLRQVQRVEPEDEATLLLELLSMGARDPVYTRSLAAAAELMRALTP
ncbi:MAG: glucose-6-phosphate dehydrogenase assembly protein OpcA [Candidatus Dormibacteraeota bacterium]|nr:glucose-6-phosphate dehydrogenase assembly protein OpcA [Candidatus Dormibacteraeota bacterium]